MKSGTAAIIGRPNSGKSSLLNAFLGQKLSIVSPNPQTTRHTILGVYSDEGGQVAFVDTPGIHKPAYRMNERMMRAMYDALEDIDLALLLVDGSVPLGAGESYTLEIVKRIKPACLLLINKIDKMAKPKLLPIMKRYSEAYPFLEIVPVSALKGDNLDLVREKVLYYLPSGDALYDREQITDRSERFLAAEFVREKILTRTREELPYTTAVIIRKFDESRRVSKSLIVIDADILVEKRSQQGIILGTGGAQLKRLGMEARRDLELLFDARVYLSLRVCTVPKWRNDDSVLDQLEVGT